MNEVSIIFNGVRYDAVENHGNKFSCEDCDFLFKCHEYNFHLSACLPLIGSRIFKKSDKKFEP